MDDPKNGKHHQPGQGRERLEAVNDKLMADEAAFQTNLATLTGIERVSALLGHYRPEDYGQIASLDDVKAMLAATETTYEQQQAWYATNTPKGGANPFTDTYGPQLQERIDALTAEILKRGG